MTEVELVKQITDYVTASGVDQNRYSQFVDAMCLYARIRKTKDREPYYNLDYISNKEIKTGKLHFGAITNHVTSGMKPITSVEESNDPKEERKINPQPIGDDIMFKHQPTVTPEYLLEKLQYCISNSGRTVESASMKLTEEVGELMGAVRSTSSQNKEKRHKNIPDSAVIEKCVDVILCALSIVQLKKPNVVPSLVLEMADARLSSWIRTQHWPMLEKYDTCGIHDHDETPTDDKRSVTEHPPVVFQRVTGGLGWDIINTWVRDTQSPADTEAAEFDSVTQKAPTCSLSLRSIIDDEHRTLSEYYKSLLHSFTKTLEFDEVEQPTDPTVRPTDNVWCNKAYSREFTSIYKWAMIEIKKLNNTISVCSKLKNKYCHHSETCKQYDEYVRGVFTLLMKVHTAMSVVYTKYNALFLNSCGTRKEIAFLVSLCVDYPRYLDAHRTWWNLHGVKFAHDKKFPFSFVPFVEEYYSDQSEV